MSTLLFAVALTLSLLVSTLLAVLLLQAMAACWPGSNRSPGTPADPPTHVVLMPAHNEEDIIATHVSSTRADLGDRGRLLVIADNCTDLTASRARAAGADVVERRDDLRRGKGFALAYGLDCLKPAPPQVVIILDADCLCEGDALGELARAAHRWQRPIQGQYDMLAQPGGPLRQRMAAFAWDFRGRFRARGFLRLGLPCQFMGSGMAFPWPLISRLELATGHLVEDLKLGLDCARTGSAPRLLPSAVVTSEFPSNEAGARSQRQRWEHGHLGMIFSAAPRLLVEGLLRRNLPLLAMTADMCVPPLALLSLLVLLNALLSLSLSLTGLAPAWLGGFGIAGLLVLFLVVLAGWWRVGRRWIGLLELASVPWYVLRKLSVYAGFLFRRQAEWIRTRRD